MIRHRAAAVRDDEFERRKILEQILLDQLHEGGGVAIDVVRAGGVEVRIARTADMDHGRHVELNHFFVQRIPPLVGQRRVGPVAPRWIGVEVAADEAELLHAAFEFRDAVCRRNTGALRQLADADEIVRIQGADPVDQFVALLRPVFADRLSADVVAHADCARRKNRQVGATLTLDLQLCSFKALANLVIGDAELASGGHVGRILRAGNLTVAVGLQLGR